MEEPRGASGAGETGAGQAVAPQVASGLPGATVPVVAPVVAPRPEVAPAPRRHEVVVEHRGAFAIATCADCGWTGRARRAVANAVDDADLHRNLGAGL